MTIDSILAFVFGVVFVIVLLIIALAVPNPTQFSMFVFRVVLSLAAAGVGAVLPGLLEIKLPGIRAGGALAFAAIVYFMNPPSLVTKSAESTARELYNEAYGYINRGNLEKAREFIDNAKVVLSKEVPDNPFFLA